MKTITYGDLILGELDQKYIDNLIDERDIDCSLLDISYVFESEDFNSTRLTNAIIGEIMHYLAVHYVNDYDDINMLLDSIFTNCIDSHYNINPDELKTQEAKDLVINFG